MNNRFSKFAAFGVLIASLILLGESAQATDAVTSQNAQETGETLLAKAVRTTSGHQAVQARMRLRTDLLGQPLVGSGAYAQWKSSVGLLLRLELSIQTGDELSSVKQISDGKDLWEHWRMSGGERVNYVDLQQVQQTLKRMSGDAVPKSSTASLASGGVPKLLRQLHSNFDFGKAEIRTGKIENAPFLAINGVWRIERLRSVAPQAMHQDEIVFKKLPAHLPHQVEVILGQENLFPYRVTYFRWKPTLGKHVLSPAVTTEFFDVVINGSVDTSQFQYERPKHLGITDRTEAFLEALGVPAGRVASRRGKRAQ